MYAIMCACVCVRVRGQLAENCPLTPTMLSKLPLAEFCRIVRPPRSHRRREQPLLIRDVGEKEGALVWAFRYQRRPQQALKGYVIFHNMFFGNVFHTLIEKAAAEVFSSYKNSAEGYDLAFTLFRVRWDSKSHFSYSSGGSPVCIVTHETRLGSTFYKSLLLLFL